MIHRQSEAFGMEARKSLCIQPLHTQKNKSKTATNCKIDGG